MPSTTFPNTRKSRALLMNLICRQYSRDFRVAALSSIECGHSRESRVSWSVGLAFLNIVVHGKSEATDEIETHYVINS